MLNSIIQIENLGKRYIIGHQQSRGRYSTFRESVTESLKTAGRKLTRTFSPGTPGNGSREEFWALRDISFEVAQGERVGIIGRNGAGKSTLLKILSRITEPTAGRIRLRGKVASLLEVGTGFHPELTGRENVFLNGAILGMTKAEIRKKFDEIVAFAEIDKFLDTPVKRYSSGMYVRLAFSVAAHLEPEILIVDEVLAVGDVQFQKKCLGKMEDAGNDGRTVLFVSHNMTAVQQLTTRCLLLHDGRIAYNGETSNAIEEYLRICNVRDSFSCVDLKSERHDFSVRSLAFDHAALAKGFNKPITFTLDLDLDKTFDDVTIRLGFTNTLGARIMTSEETIPRLPAGGSRIILTVVDHRLPPGSYGVFIAVLIKRRKILSRDEAVNVLIPAEGIDDLTLLRRRDRLGVFVKPAIKVIPIA
jgi:lipopolysaccharide transport system ATP-binding protein